MADFKNPDGAVVSANINKLGQQIYMPWLKQAELEGRVYSATIGTGVTPIDFVETAYDEDQPQFALLVPDGIITIPVFLSTAIQDAPGVNNATLVQICGNDIGVSDGAAMTTEGNVNGAFGGKTSASKARQLYTSNAAVAVNPIVIGQRVNAFLDAVTSPELYYTWEEDELPLLVGPASLFVHIVAGTKQEGFLSIKWVEYLASELR